MSLKESNDNLARQLIRKLRGNRCERCGADGEYIGLEWAHIKGRRALSMRWEMLNALLLCKLCHEWSHKNESKRDEWIEKHFPGRLKTLQGMWNDTSVTMDYIQMKKINLSLKQQL